MENKEEEGGAFGRGGGRGGGGGRGTTTMTTAMTMMKKMTMTIKNTMATKMATDRIGGGGTGGGGAGLLPGIDKNNDNSNMNARKRTTNTDKTASKAKTKTGVGGKGGGLDTYLGWSTNFLAGRQFDIYVDSEGGSADENSPGQDKSAFEAEHQYPTNQIAEGKKNQLPKKKSKFSRRIKKTPTPSSQQVQNITPNSSISTSTRNRSITKNMYGSGAKKDEGAVDDHPLANLNPAQIC